MEDEAETDADYSDAEDDGVPPPGTVKSRDGRADVPELAEKRQDFGGTHNRVAPVLQHHGQGRHPGQPVG